MNKFFSVFVILCLIGASSSKNLRVSYSGDLHPAHRRLSEEGLLNLKVDGRGYFGFRLRVSVTDASADGSQAAHSGLYDQGYGAAVVAQVGTAASSDYQAASSDFVAQVGTAAVKCVYTAATGAAGSDASCGAGATNAARCSRAAVAEGATQAEVLEGCVNPSGTEAVGGDQCNINANLHTGSGTAADATAAAAACATGVDSAGDTCTYTAYIAASAAVPAIAPLAQALNAAAAIAAKAVDDAANQIQPGSSATLAALNLAAKTECELLNDVDASVGHIPAAGTAQVGSPASSDYQASIAANLPASNTPLTADDEKIYSRDGSLHINKYGYLVDDNGLLLFGSGEGETDVEAKKHIHIPSRAGDVIVTPSGKVLAEENGGASFQIAGQIKLTRFENPQGLNIRLKMKSNCAAANEDGFALGNWCAGGELDGKDHTYLSETLVSGVGIEGNPGDQGFGRISS